MRRYRWLSHKPIRAMHFAVAYDCQLPLLFFFPFIYFHAFVIVINTNLKFRLAIAPTFWVNGMPTSFPRLHCRHRPDFQTAFILHDAEEDRCCTMPLNTAFSEVNFSSGTYRFASRDRHALWSKTRAKALCFSRDFKSEFLFLLYY